MEIFFRYTNRRKVIVVCPVNTIQNWGNEFNKWLPEKDVSGNVLRNFRVFLLGDAVKGLPARAQLISEFTLNIDYKNSFASNFFRRMV